MRLNSRMIVARKESNSYAYGSKGYRVFMLYTVGLTVEQIIAKGKERYGYTRRQVQRQIFYDVRRGRLILSIDGVDLNASVSAALSATRTIDPFSETFGVEIEFMMPPGTTSDLIAMALCALGVPTHSEIYNHVTRSHWKVVTDNSLISSRSGWYGREIVSPVLRGEAGLASVTTVCNYLTSIGCQVNRTCGLHVHVGARGADLRFFKNLTALYAAHEHLIDDVMPPSRRGSLNRYCKTTNAIKNRVASAENTASAIGHRDDRYYKLNLSAFWRHGTIEFRHHSGTVDAAKTCEWVRFCLCMAATVKSMQGTSVPMVDTLEGLMDMIKVNSSTRDYFVSRRAHFAGGALEEVA